MTTYASGRLIHKTLFWWLTGLTGLIVLILLAIYLNAGTIQSAIAEEARAALHDAGLDTVRVASAGRDIQLQGRTFDDTDQQRAVSIAAAVPGVRKVVDELSIGAGLAATAAEPEAPAPVATPEPVNLRSPALAFHRQDNQLTITGELATSDSLQSLIRDLDDTLDINSSVSYSDEVAAADWFPALMPVLTTLPLISQARIDVAGPLLNIEGDVGSEQVYRTISERIAGIDPVQLTVKNMLTITDSAPVPQNTLDPLEEPSFSASFGENGQLLLTGKLADQASLERLLSSLSDTYSAEEIDNQIEITDRVSRAAWIDDVMQILPGMKQLEQARVTVRNGSLNISGAAVSADVAREQQDATDALDTALEVKNEIVLLENTSDDARSRLEDELDAIEFDRILFALNSADLEPTSRETLDSLAGVLKRYPALPVVVAGHTDNTGKAEWNQYLSQLRAESVRDYLIQQGVNQDRISAIGYGQTRPLVSNETRQGRIQNRRIELNF